MFFITNIWVSTLKRIPNFCPSFLSIFKINILHHFAGEQNAWRREDVRLGGRFPGVDGEQLGEELGEGSISQDPRRSMEDGRSKCVQIPDKRRSLAQRRRHAQTWNLQRLDWKQRAILSREEYVQWLTQVLQKIFEDLRMGGAASLRLTPECRHQVASLGEDDG